MQNTSPSFGRWALNPNCCAAGTAAFALFAAMMAIPTANAEEDHATIVGSERYAPIQAIAYALGANKLSGYFQQLDGKCALTLMLTKNADPALSSPDAAPARIRVAIRPGDDAWIDSVEGEGVGVSCNAGAATVTAVHFNRSRRVVSEETGR